MRKEIEPMKRVLYVLLICFLVLGLMPAGTVFADSVKVPFLLYHSVVDNDEPIENILLHVTKDTFSHHMNSIKYAGYNTITLDEYYDAVTQNAPLPPNPIVICFDDGYENNYTNAFPVLKELGMKATIFVLPAYMGAQYLEYPHFTWEQAIEMEESGLIDIESHSFSHPSFAELDRDETIRQMRLSKYLIEKNMNKTCNYMAYPYGFTNSFSAEEARRCGYKLLCVVGNSVSDGKSDGLSEVKRLTVTADMDGSRLLGYIEENMR